MLTARQARSIKGWLNSARTNMSRATEQLGEAFDVARTSKTTIGPSIEEVAGQLKRLTSELNEVLRKLPSDLQEGGDS